MSPPGCCFNCATASDRWPRSSVELGQRSGSLSVREATYLSALLSAGVNGLSWVFQ
jgi:hypothetical protein